MKEYERHEIIRYLIDNTPIIFDMEKQDLMSNSFLAINFALREGNI